MPDGGLSMPAEYPQLNANDLQRLSTLSYRELAYEILRLYITDIPADDLRDIVNRTYTAEAFGSEQIVPLKALGTSGLHLLKVSEGPTLAFKDIAMQLLGHLFEYVLKKQNRKLNILGATSGDTGSAAEYAMRGKDGVNVFMLSPHGRMSPFQQAQMFSLQDANIHNLAVEGVFDDCQDIVKAVGEDAPFKAKYSVGTVNSINWARVCAQVVYYFWGYFRTVKSNQSNERVSFCVPSGNFGNILAGHVARMMGLPIGRLILATNENNVLDEFFRTGRYQPRGAANTFETSSPSMDISKASNFERFIFDLVNRDASLVTKLFKKIATEGQFDLNQTTFFADIARYQFVSGASSHAKRLKTIASVFRDYQVVIDPHTADGVAIAQELQQANETICCLETALPAKFEATIREAIGDAAGKLHVPNGYDDIESRPKQFTVVPNSYTAVVDYLKSKLPL